MARVRFRFQQTSRWIEAGATKLKLSAREGSTCRLISYQREAHEEVEDLEDVIVVGGDLKDIGDSILKKQKGREVVDRSDASPKPRGTRPLSVAELLHSLRLQPPSQSTQSSMFRTLIQRQRQHVNKDRQGH